MRKKSLMSITKHLLTTNHKKKLFISLILVVRFEPLKGQHMFSTRNLFFGTFFLYTIFL